MHRYLLLDIGNHANAPLERLDYDEMAELVKDYRISSFNFPTLLPATFAKKRGGKLSEERR